MKKFDELMSVSNEIENITAEEAKKKLLKIKKKSLKKYKIKKNYKIKKKVKKVVVVVNSL